MCVGKRPRAAGHCVKRIKKNSRPCDTHADCPDGVACVHLGRSRQRFCHLARPIQQNPPWQSELQQPSESGAARGSLASITKSLGGLSMQIYQAYYYSNSNLIDFSFNVDTNSQNDYEIRTKKGNEKGNNLFVYKL